MNEKKYRIEYTFLFAVLILLAVVTQSYSFDVRVTWVKSPSEGVTGYNIYRSVDSGAYGADKKIGSVGKDALEYVDTNLVGGVVYYYVVTAIGSDNVESDYSDEISVEPADYGDLDGDGKINPGDALTIMKIFDQAVTPTKKQQSSADMNHDGRITPQDALCALLKFIKKNDPDCP
jgi:hypothetical protein